MADVTGVSNGSAQSVITTRAFTAANIQLLFPTQINSIPVRVGYGFVLATTLIAPGYRRIIWQGDLQLPGVWINFDPAFGFTNVHYLFYVRWNQSNLQWLARYA